MKLLPTLACLLLCASNAAQAETIDILGLSLGKTFQAPLPQCAAEEASASAKNLCWASPPDILEGGIQSGIVNVPDADKQPQWAAQGKYAAAITRDGKLAAFTVHTARAEDFAEIARFLAARFGAPRHPSSPGAQTASAYWNAKYAQIELTCPSGNGCDTKLVFTDWNERTQRGLDQLRNAETPMPAAPALMRR